MKTGFRPWKILHLDLSHELKSLPANASLQGYYLVFWWQTLPLGKRQVFADELPLSAAGVINLAVQTILPTVSRYLSIYSKETAPRDASAALLSLTEPLATLFQAWKAKEVSPHLQEAVAETSVVLCTRDRPEQLATCLRSLQALVPAPKEVLVVDNAPSSAATRQLVQQQFPDAQYILESKPGLSTARNIGIQHSTGKFIAFTDDDVRVHPQWLLRLHRAFNCPNTLAVTGLIIPAILETEAQVIFELEQGCLSGDYQPQGFDQRFFETTRSHGVPVWKIGAGANMAFRRSAFDQLGLFDTRLGAGASGCSEDSEFWYRILAAGGECRYEPTAVVYHGHRQDLDRLNHQMHQYMRGHMTALMVQFANYRHWGNLYRLAFALPKHYVGLGLGFLIKNRSAKRQTYWAETSGCLAGIGYYFVHRKPVSHTDS